MPVGTMKPARPLGVVPQGLLDDRFEGGADEFLRQAVGRVVRAGELAGVAFGCRGGFIRPMANKFAPTLIPDEGEAALGHFHHRHQFQQAFVDAAQFFRVHVAVVDAGQGGAFAEKAQAEDSVEQVAVFQLGAIQVRAAVGGEQAAQGGQTQGRLAQAGESDGQRLPQVAVAVVMPAFGGQVAQARQRIAALIQFHGLVGGIRGEHQAAPVFGAAVFQGSQEDQPVNQTQQLLEQRRGGQLAAVQSGAQGIVAAVLDETGTQRPQGIGYPVAQTLAGTGAALPKREAWASSQKAVKSG
jgi:hypothetical protein